MPLETATFISDLTASNPAHTDGLNQADSHMRLTKAVLKNTFPNFTPVALQSSQAQIDAATAAIAGTAYYRFLMGTAVLPALTPLGDPDTGFYSPAANSIAWSVGGVVAGLVAADKSLTLFGPVSATAVASTGAFSGGTGQLVPIGAVLEWYDDVLPPEGGYAWANGQIITNAAVACPVLLARWGSRFGGNGVSTMGVPDRRDTVGVGKSTMGGASSRGLQTLTNTVLGTLIGLANNVLLAVNLPPITSRNASQNINVATSGIFVPRSGTSLIQDFPSTPGSGLRAQDSTTSSGILNSAGINDISVVSTGTNSTPVNNVQPSTTCNYIVRLG